MLKVTSAIFALFLEKGPSLFAHNDAIHPLFCIQTHQTRYSQMYHLCVLFLNIVENYICHDDVFNKQLIEPKLNKYRTSIK